MTEHEGSGSEGLSEPVIEAFSKGYYEISNSVIKDQS